MVETVLTALAPIVVTLLLGFAAAWHQDFGAKDATVLNRMVLLYAVPVALFVGTVGTSRGELVQDVAFAVAMCVAIVGMYTLVFLLFRFMLRFSLGESVLAALAASAPAAPFMGPAILGDLLGKASATSIAIAALVTNLVVVPVTIFGLGLGKPPVASTARPTGHYSGFSEKLLETLKQPMVWAPLLAFALVLSDVKIPAILGRGLSLLSHASAGVAIFACGILLATYKIRIDWTVSLLVEERGSAGAGSWWSGLARLRRRPDRRQGSADNCDSNHANRDRACGPIPSGGSTSLFYSLPQRNQFDRHDGSFHRRDAANDLTSRDQEGVLP